MQILHKNIEACAKKVVVGVEYLFYVLPNFSHCWRFVHILLNDIVWACESLDDVWGIRRSHFMFHYERIR